MRRTLICALTFFLAGCATTPPVQVRAERTAITSDSDIERMLPALTNWGRWGADDQLGTLNYISDAVIRDALKLARDGRTVPLARPVTLAVNPGVRRATYELEKHESGSRDYLGAVWHGFAQTHLDALCHSFANEGAMYNGISTGEITAAGCGKLDITVIANRGVVGRGVLLDIGALRGADLALGSAIRIDDLEEAARRQRVTIRSGDILLVRTGAGVRNTRERRTGLHPECLPWLQEKQITLLMSDGDSDVAPLSGFDRFGSAMHSVAIPYLGLPLVDNAELDEVARVSASMRRWEFLIVIAPWRMTGATSSPVNPIAIF